MASFGFVWCRLSAIIFLGLASGEKREASGGGGGGGLGPGCTRLADTIFSFLHQTGQTMALTCPKECSNDTLWYHTRTHDATLELMQDHGPQLELPFTAPPSPMMVGFFCCVCEGDHSKMDSCCFGVGYSPEVSSFWITDGKEEVKALHTGQKVVMKCTVYGYPGTDTRAEIVGPPGFNDQGTLSHGSYEAVYVVNIPQVTVDHSGSYTCQGRLTLTQGGQVGQEKSDDVIRKSLVVYDPPSITFLGQKDIATDESVTFVCEVSCSIDYNITWLHNGTVLNITSDGNYHTFNGTAGQHKLTVTLTSPSDVGIYTCVVNTEFELSETNTSIGFKIASPGLGRVKNLPGPVADENTALHPALTAIVIAVLVLGLPAVIFGALWKKYVAGKVRCKRRRTRQEEEERIPLERQGDLETGSDTDKDGPSYASDLRSLEVAKGLGPRVQKRKNLRRQF